MFAGLPRSFNLANSASCAFPFAVKEAYLAFNARYLLPYPMKKELTNSFDKTFLTIEFDEANNWIYNNWVGVLPTEKVIQGCQATLEFLRENPSPHMLNDNREVVGSWSKANDWIAQNWMPQALSIGLKRFAHIVSPGIFGQASAAEMITRVGNQFEMRLFQDIEKAKAWLRGA